MEEYREDFREKGAGDSRKQLSCVHVKPCDPKNSISDPARLKKNTMFWTLLLL